MSETEERHTCPRRVEVGRERQENEDTWVTGHGLVGRQAEVERSCSFCGCLNPATFMRWLRDGGEVGPTDKSYKVYVKCPYPDPRDGETKTFTVDCLSGQSVKGTSVYGVTAKFYFQHLSVEQQHEFIQLYNDKRMNIGYPGHFYVLPYFCGRATPA